MTSGRGFSEDMRLAHVLADQADSISLDRFKARKVAAEKLNELGVLVKEEPYQNNVGFSERADVPIEPPIETLG